MGTDDPAACDCDCGGGIGLQGLSGGAPRGQEEASCEPETGEGQSGQDGVLPSGRDGWGGGAAAGCTCATPIAAQALQGSPDADGGAITSVITGHPGHAHHASSTGADAINVAVQEQAQATWCGAVPQHQRQASASAGSGAKGDGGATMWVRTWGVSGSKRRQEASALLEAGRARSAKSDTTRSQRHCWSENCRSDAWCAKSFRTLARSCEWHRML